MNAHALTPANPTSWLDVVQRWPALADHVGSSPACKATPHIPVALYVWAVQRCPEAVPALTPFLADGSLDEQDPDGTTALTAAATHQPFLVRFLLKAGADVHGWDQWGLSATHHACWRNPGIVSVLLEAGADPKQRSKHGMPLLNLVCQPGRAGASQSSQDDSSARLHALRLLLEAGANPNAADHEGHTALGDACTFFPEAVPGLLAAGADVNQSDQFDVTALMRASRQYPHLVPVLLAAGAQVHGVSSRDDGGRTALCWALEIKDPRAHVLEAVNALLDAGANPNHRAHNGRTPFMEAAQHVDGAAFDCLLERGGHIPDLVSDPGVNPGAYPRAAVAAWTQWRLRHTLKKAAPRTPRDRL